MQRKIGAYIRVSTEEQASAFEGSLANQRYRAKSYVDLKNSQEKGWGSIVEFYVDDGYSAKDTKRPAYQRMISDLKRKKIDFILVSDLSRLSRNLLDFCELLNFLEKHKANFLSIKEQFDTSTSVGRLMVYLVITLAQFEREQTSERVSLGVYARGMRGLLNGARPILGLDKNPDKPGTYVVNDNEAESVRKIFRHFLNTGSRAKTIQELEKEGIEPKIGRKYGSLKIDEKWTSQTLGGLLSSAAYIGFHEVNKANKNADQDTLKLHQRYQLVKASWPGIVPEAEFYEAQRLLQEAQKLERVRLEGAEDRFYILSGILRCCDCGHPLVGQAAHGEKSIHRYYGHTRAGAKFDCRYKRIPAEEVEAAVLEYLWDATKDAGYLSRIETNIKSMNNVRSLDVAREKKSVKERINGLKVRRENLLKMQGHSTDAEALQEMAKMFEAMTKELAGLERQLKQLEEMPERTQIVSESTQEISERLHGFARGFKKAGGAMKKRLIRRALKQVLVTPEGLKMYMLLAGQEDIPNHQLKLVREESLGDNKTPLYVLTRRASGEDSKLVVLRSDNELIGDPGEIRTPDLMLRRHLLYPTELRDRMPFYKHRRP